MNSSMTMDRECEVDELPGHKDDVKNRDDREEARASDDERPAQTGLDAIKYYL